MTRPWGIEFKRASHHLQRKYQANDLPSWERLYWLPFRLMVESDIAKRKTKKEKIKSLRQVEDKLERMKTKLNELENWI